MSKGVPIAQRPDLKDATLSARLDAVFGSLGPAGGAGGWSLRQDVQFRSGGGIDEYNYSSDEEDPNEGLQPLMPSRLVDSDDEDGTGTKCDDVPPLERAELGADADDGGSERRAEERALRDRERLRASLSSRRAFEAEAEEDEFDRVATSTMDIRNRLADAKPPGFTEVPWDSSWERLHNRWERQQQEQQQPDQEQEQSDEGTPAPVSEAAVAPGTADMAMEEGGDTAPTGAAAAVIATPAPALTTAGGESASTVGVVPSRKRTRGPQAAEGAAAGGGPGAASAPARTTGGDVAAGDVEMMAAVGEDGGADTDAAGDAAVVCGGGFVGVTSETAAAQLAAVGARTEGDGTAAAEVAAAPRQRGGRRVQWADFVAASRPGDADPSHSRDRDNAAAPNGDGSGPKDEERGRGGGAAGRSRGGRVRLDWQRRGFVPDHVRNPQKYTMYTLDEELVVGGGDRNGANGRNGRNGSHAAGAGASWRGGEVQGEDEMRQALASARNAVAAAPRVEHDPERAETTFGSGITFRSRTQRQVPPQAVATAPRSANGTAEVDGHSLHPQGQEPRRREAGNGGAGAAQAAGALRGMFTDMEGSGGEEEDGGRGKGAGAEGPSGAGGGRGGGGEGDLTQEGDARNGGLRGGGRRHFRARRAAAEDEEGKEKDGAGGPTGAMQED